MNIKKLQQMIKEPASKEWFAKHGSPKNKALQKASHHETIKTPHGNLTFPTKHHPDMIKHEAHRKELEGRKANYWKSLEK